MKKTILTTAIILVLLLTGVSAAISIRTVPMKKIETAAQITEEPMDVSKPVESKYQRRCFLFADIDSSGYAKRATVSCFDGIISVTYSNGVTNVNSPFGPETFTGSHSVHIYGFGGTKNWAGSVTNRDVSFGGFVLICLV